jgi:hypothetical protein
LDDADQELVVIGPCHRWAGFWTPQKSMPLVFCGVALRRQGPGDWMFLGQLTLVEVRTMPWNAASSAALSLANV